MLARKTRSGAFTLLELIVVLVVLGLLAALAIPTFSKVIERSHDQVTLTSLESFTREAQALAAFDQGPYNYSHLSATASDLSASAPGLLAAAPALVDALTRDPNAGEIGYALSSDGSALLVARRSSDDRLCIVGSSPTQMGKGSCGQVSADAPKLKNTLSSGATAYLPPGVSFPSVTPPDEPVDEPPVEEPVATPPAAPTDVTGVAGNGQVEVSFAPGAPGSAPPAYTVTASPGGASATGSSPLLVTGLTNGVSYTFTVKAVSSAGEAVSLPSAPVMPAVNVALNPAKELQPGVIGKQVPGTATLPQISGVAPGVSANGDLFVGVGVSGWGYVAKIVNGTPVNISGPLGEISGISVTSAGELYVSVAETGTISRLTPQGDGTYTRTIVTSAAARPMSPTVAADGSVYYGEQHGARLMRVLPGTTVPVPVAQLTGPLGYTVLAPGNKIYIAGGSRVYALDVATQQVTTVIESASLSYALGLGFGFGGKLYISDYLAGKVFRLEANNTLTTIANVSSPHGISFDANGSLYVSYYNGGVYRLDP